MDQRPNLVFSRADAPQHIPQTAIGPISASGNDALPGCVRKPFDRKQADPDGIALTGPANLTGVDIRWQDFEPHAPCFGNIGKGAVKTALVADDRRYKFGRVVDLEVGRLEGDPGIRRTMRFAK